MGVLFFAICAMEDLEGSFRLLCDRCYRELGRLGVLFFVFCVIEDLEVVLYFAIDVIEDL